MANSKKEIVKMLLNEELPTEDESQLLKLLAEKPIAIDIDKQHRENATIGDRVADKFTEFAGSWAFILGFSAFLIFWVVLNTFLLVNGFDEYPFILLNLLLSCIAALQAPIIMMSQNRQAKRESIRNNNDYRIDLKSELILEEVYLKINTILNNQNKIMKYLKNDNKKSKQK